jgi:hypothetical protein
MWIMTTWQCISPEVTVMGLKKCPISSAVDGADNDMLWNGSKENGYVRSKCEEDEGTDCEDGSSALIGKGS